MPPPEQRSRVLRALAALEVAALLLVGVWALIFQLRLPGRLPTEGEYERVRAHLSEHARAGDVVLLHPWWTERARLFVPAALPVVGYHGSDDDPLIRHPRIWVLSQPRLPGADRSGFDAAFLPGRAPEGEPVRFGHLELQAFRNTRHRPVRFALSESLAGAEVALEGADGQPTPCRRVSADAFRCPGNLRVAVEWHEINAEPRRCVWAAPPGRGRRLVINVPTAPQAAEWSLEAGYVWDRGFHHGPTLTPTQIRIEGAGTEGIDLTLPVGLEGVQRASAEGLGGGALRVTVSSHNAELRDVCLDLFGYAPGGAP